MLRSMRIDRHQRHPDLIASKEFASVPDKDRIRKAGKKVHAMKAKRTWILVADGAKARVFELAGIGKGIRQLPGLEESISLPANHELQDDRPGRAFESGNPTRHAFDAGDPHRAMKRSFACHLIKVLSKLHQERAFDSLVLVAPPEMLGNLRSELSEGLLAVIAGELARDLTHLPAGEIAGHLEGLMPV